MGPKLKAIMLAIAAQAHSGPTVTPALAASRVSGPAPLAVQFDAVGTTSSAVSDPFRQVLYTFDYGDSGAGTWATNGLSKNSDAGGPISAHVFETPGTYTVRVIANDGTSSDQKTVTITVLDPEVFYAGKTICVSTDGSTGWGPAGATYTTTIPDLSMNSPYSGYRILFKRGQDFSANAASSIYITTNVQDVCIGAAGSGANPVLQTVQIGNSRPQPATPVIWPDRIVVSDITMTAGYTAGGFGSHHLFLRCTNASATDPCNIGWQTYWIYDDTYRYIPLDQWVLPHFHFIVDCHHPGGSAQSYNVYGMGCNASILGSTFDAVQYHNVRLTEAYKTIVAHNAAVGICTDPSFHTLKVHGGSLNDFPGNLTSANSRDWASRYVVVQNNKFGSTGCPYYWVVALCPQNDGSAEGVEDFLVIGNEFVRNTAMEGSQVDLILGGRRLTQYSNTGSTGTFNTSTGHTGSLPAEWLGPYYTSRA